MHNVSKLVIFSSFVLKWGVFICVNVLFFLFFVCSDEEVINVSSSPEVVEIPPPSPEVVKVSLPPRRGPKVKPGHWHLDREQVLLCV